MRHYRTPTAISAVVALLLVTAAGLAFWQASRSDAQDQQPVLEYPRFPPTPTIGPNPTTAPAPQSAAPLAVASFDDPAGISEWTFVPMEPIALAEQQPVWAIEDGRLAQRFTAAAGNPSTLETAALSGAAGWSDYHVQVSFYDLYNGTAGLIARYSGADPLTASYYRYRILKQAYPATPRQVLEKVDQGVVTTLAEIKEPGFRERQWHVLAMSIVGGTITVTLDGVVVAEAVDANPLGAGRAGIYTRSMGGILFDDFSITTW